MSTPMEADMVKQHASEKEQLWQGVGIVVSIVALALYAVYFFSVSINDHSFISDNLNHDLVFRWSTSFCVAVQNVLFIAYFWRFHNVHLPLCITGVVAVLLSEAGWIWLCCVFVPPGHFLGFGLYVSGLLVFWVCIFLFEKIQFFMLSQLYVPFFAAFLFCVTYSLFYILYNDIAWTYEHIAMMLAQMANILFFRYHNPDPEQAFILARSLATSKYNPLANSV